MVARNSEVTGRTAELPMGAGGERPERAWNGVFARGFVTAEKRGRETRCGACPPSRPGLSTPLPLPSVPACHVVGRGRKKTDAGPIQAATPAALRHVANAS